MCDAFKQPAFGEVAHDADITARQSQCNGFVGWNVHGIVTPANSCASLR